MRSSIVALIATLIVGCSAIDKAPRDRREEPACAEMTWTVVRHLHYSGTQETEIHEIRVNSIYNDALFLRAEIQEYYLVTYLLGKNEQLPDSVFENSPSVSMLCVLNSEGSGPIRKHLTLQFVGRRIARVLNSSPDLKLDLSNLVVVDRCGSLLVNSQGANKLRSTNVQEVACERFSEFKRHFEEGSQ